MLFDIQKKKQKMNYWTLLIW